MMVRTTSLWAVLALVGWVSAAHAQATTATDAGGVGWDAAAHAQIATATEKPLSSPQAAIQAVLDSSNRALAEKTLPTKGVSVNPAVREATIASIARILQTAGWTQESAVTLAPGAGFTADSFTLIPFTSTAASDVNTKSDLISQQLQGGESLVLERGTGDVFRFSPESVATQNLDAIARAAEQARRIMGVTEYASVSDWMSINAPESMLKTYLFLRLWQWIGLAAAVFLGLVVDLIVRFALGAILRIVLQRFNSTLEPKAIKRSIRGFGLLAAAIVWFGSLSLLGLPLAAFEVIQPVAKVVFIIAVTWCLWRIIDLIGEIFCARANKTDTKLDDILVPMVRKTAKAVVVIFTLLNIAPLFGLEVGPLLAAVGVGTVALGFAFKNTIENIFGSVTVILDKPFQVGDWVVYNNVEGTVESVGMRSTRVRTFYNSLVTIPNSVLITEKVDNYGMRKYRRWSTTFGLVMSTPPALIDAYCEAIREIIRVHPYTRKDYYQVWLNTFGDSTYNIMIYLFWEAPDWQTELRERHRFMLDVLRISEAMGIEFAYPTQTLLLNRSGEAATSPMKNLAAESPDSLRSEARDLVRSMMKDAPWHEEKPPKYRFFSAEETATIDREGDEARRQKMEDEFQKTQESDLPSSSSDGDDADFTDQRDSGG